MKLLMAEEGNTDMMEAKRIIVIDQTMAVHYQSSRDVFVLPAAGESAVLGRVTIVAVGVDGAAPFYVIS